MQDIFDKEDESEFFNDQLNCNPKLDLRQLLKEKKLKFNDKFRIGNIQELVLIEYGDDFSQSC